MKINIEHQLLKRKRKTISTTELDCRIDVKITEKDKTVFTREQKMHSFVSNFVYTLAANLAGETTYSDILNNSGAALTVQGVDYQVTAGTTGATDIGTHANAAYGIMIGDLNNLTSGSKTTYRSAMQTTIGYPDYHLRRSFNSSGATTEFTAGATTVSMPSTSSLKISRSYTYSGTNPAYISEIGLMADETSDGTISVGKVLLARDLFTDGINDYVAITTGQTITINYSFNITNSSGYKNNFLSYLRSKMEMASATNNVINTIGNTASMDFSGNASESLLAPDASSDYGIVLSSYQSKYPLNSQNTQDYSDATNKIASVSSSATTGIYYSAVTAISVTKASNVTSFGIFRDFENMDSTSNVDIARAYMIMLDTKNYMISDANLDSTTGYVTIPPNEILRVKFYLSMPLAGDVAIS